MMLRRFNDSGLKAFGDMLAHCRSHPADPMNEDLLETPQFTSELQQAVEVEQRVFKTRGDAVVYLESVLSAIPDFEVEQDAGLWSWLSLFYFDQVCPLKAGERKVRNDYHYNFEPRNQRHFYRHLLFVGWKARKIDPSNCRLFLHGPVNLLDQVTQEVMKRLFLTRVPCMFEMLDRLYWDPSRSRPRSGIVTRKSPKGGDLIHRLPIRIRQLEKTYDLMSLTADQILELLGEEFSFASSKSLELFD
jgi:hypothetical protein